MPTYDPKNPLPPDAPLAGPDPARGCPGTYIERMNAAKVKGWHHFEFVHGDQYNDGLTATAPDGHVKAVPYLYEPEKL